MSHVTSDLYRGVPEEQVARLLRFRSEHPSRQTSIAGVPWQYIAAGRGEDTLLVLHGGLRIAETAFPYVRMFERSYRVIVPTYPPLRTMGEITAGIAALLDREQAGRAFVLGQSYGGTVAQVFIRRYPARASKLVLSSAHPLVASRKERLLLLPIGSLVLALLSLLPGKLPQRVFRRGILAVLAVPEAERAFWNAYLDEIIMHRFSRADVLSLYRTSLDAIRRYAYAAGERSDWTGEVLVIGGENDPTNPESGRRRMLELYPQARAHLIRGGGHTAAMSRAQEYAGAIGEFLGLRPGDTPPEPWPRALAP